MTKIKLICQGDLQIQATHESSGITLKTDAPIDNQGKGRGFSPTDLVATALGSCMGTIMEIVANQSGIHLEGMTISVEKSMTKRSPRSIERLKVNFDIPKKLPLEDQKRLEKVAKACPVCLSLHPHVEIITHFHWA